MVAPPKVRRECVKGPDTRPNHRRKAKRQRTSEPTAGQAAAREFVGAEQKRILAQRKAFHANGFSGPQQPMPSRMALAMASERWVAEKRMREETEAEAAATAVLEGFTRQRRHPRGVH